MKKILAFLLAAMLTFSLAACGSARKDKPAETRDEQPAAAPQPVEEPEETPEADPETDDDALVEELKNILVGEWYVAILDLEQLTFREDGTGHYVGINDKDLSFTYRVYVDHMTYGNGVPYINNMLEIHYDTGETELIIFFFNEQGQMGFHNSDDGGYSGVINYIDVWTKK